ncbi:nitrophenyl compound nitroreductase subunit ArsF family protein [Planctomycetota bacterium]
MKEKAVRIIRGSLLAFVFVTIGFALGKESARRAAARVVPDAPAAAAESAGNAQGSTRVIVYYAHTTLRCVTCNTIEETAKKAIDAQFAVELADGAVEWQTENFQENDVFARSHEIISSCIVVAHMKNDREVDYRRLDEVWTLVKDPPKLEKYVVDAVREFLPGGKEDE